MLAEGVLVLLKLFVLNLHIWMVANSRCKSMTAKKRVSARTRVCVCVRVRECVCVCVCKYAV
jgi:hypothetical protein